MQTSGCNSHGPVTPESDKSCSAKLKSTGESGYCLCAKGIKVYGSGCGAPAGAAGKTCSQVCNQPVPGRGPSGQTGKELVLQFNSALQSQGNP